MRTRDRTRRLAFAATFIGTLLLAGCAGVPPPRAGYDHRVDALDAIDPARLAGKRIVVDPGHGGYFRGALGVRGLTEAEVNLGVSLELARLLRGRGAEVMLTREIDRDFLTPADSSLRSDLTERVRMANAFRPDLFVSVHHNADARGSHDVNEVQVYYQLGDEGPALEAAADVHRFLTRNLGIGSSRLIPGNFAVLRGSEAPALLTESSYITYPPTEQKLRREEARRLEAEAIYLGIAAFFSRRAPVVEGFMVWAPGTAKGDSVFSSGLLRLQATVRGAFDVTSLVLDGISVAARREGSRIAWEAAPALTAGAHEATLAVRLAGEGSSQRARVRFVVNPTPDSLVVEFPDQPFWDGQQRIGMRVRVMSREGVLVRDTLSIRVQAGDGGLIEPADTVVTLRDGAAWAYLRPSERVAHGTRGRRLVSRVSLAGDSLKRVVTRATLAMNVERVPEAFTCFALRMPEETPLVEAPGTREPDPRVRWINRDGFVFTKRFAVNIAGRDGSGPARDSGIPALAGYRPWEGNSLLPPRFVPIADGALHNRRIVIDAAGGGDDAAGTSRSGGRGAALNLEAARMLQSMLEAAGADVRMTRTRDAAVSELERVRISEEFRADRYVRIGHPAAAPRLGHYFSSAAGRRWAERLAEIAVALGLPRPSIGDDAQYPIQQTSATALYAGLGRVDSTGDALGGFDPARLRSEAYALYLSLAREWAPAAEWPLDSLEVRDATGRPIPRAVVRLGGALVLQTDPFGRIRFARTEPGPMLVEVEESTPAIRRVLLDSDRGVVLTGADSP